MNVVTGWEIKPLGWIILAIATGIAVYVIVTLHNNKDKEIKG